MIKAILPKHVKLSIKLALRWLNDFQQGNLSRFAKRKKPTTEYTHRIELKQALRPNPAKEHNLAIAAGSISSVHIFPDEIFSFWKAVGNPSEKRGFKASRSIVGGKVEKSVGGGLCQLSGMVYYISLMAGLEVMERYNHSIDIYDEETRFTPLGSDATVAYGYKDLRIRNSLQSPIKFSFLIEKEYIAIYLSSIEPFKAKEISFIQRKASDISVNVETYIGDRLVADSFYKRGAHT
ncbi:MAG: VanW family protein [Bacteroidota bacterium]